MAPSALKIKVICRLRPHLTGKGEVESDSIASMANSTVSLDSGKGQIHHFPFSSVYDQHSTQEEIYEGHVRAFVEESWTGRISTVFAYGVSGSGKTHTVSGYDGDHGLIPRTIQDLLATAAERQTDNNNVHLRFSFMELWRDQCRDLMVDTVRGDKRADLPIREDAHGKIIVTGLSETVISDYAEFDEYFRVASARRSTGSTKLNDTSSRSHAVLTIIVSTEENGRIVEGRISMVDLAGSESNKRSGNAPNSDRMKESNEINKSLSALRNVVSALNKGESRIPYRDSKLTRILSDVLGGEAAGLVICNIAPTTVHYLDTLATLTFAGLSRNVENRPVINERDARPAPTAHFAAAQPVRFGASASRPIAPIRSRLSHPPISSTTTARTMPPSTTFSFSAPTPSAMRRPLMSRPSTLPPLAQGGSAPPPSALDAAVLARLAALEAKLERRYSADGEASFGDSSFESAGSMSSEWDRRGSSGSFARGRKRERDPEEEREVREKDAQMQEMRVRMEMLERKLAEMSTSAAPRPAIVASRLPARRKSEEDRESKRKQLLALGHQHELLCASTSSRIALHTSIASYSQALRLGAPSARLSARIAVLQEAYDRQLPVDFIEKEQAEGGRLLSTMAPRPEAHTVKKARELGVLGERGNVLQGSASKLAPLKRVVQQVRVSDVSDYSSATATDSEADRSVDGVPLLEEDRARLESLLVECFNSMDVKQIRMLKGVGAKRAQDIVNSIDENGEIETYSDVCGFPSKALEKILTDNVHLLD